MCAHIMRFTSLGFRSRCLMPQHVPLAFTKLTKCLLGHFLLPIPNRPYFAKYRNILLTFGPLTHFSRSMVRESLKIIGATWAWNESKKSDGLGWNYMSLQLIHLSIYSWENSMSYLCMAGKTGKNANYSPWTLCASICIFLHLNLKQTLVSTPISDA